VRPIYRTDFLLPSKYCILYIFSTNISTEYFKHAAHSPFLFSKCRLFHNATFFGSCIIHILHTGVLKLNVKLRCQKVKSISGLGRVCSTQGCQELHKNFFLERPLTPQERKNVHCVFFVETITELLFRSDVTVNYWHHLPLHITLH
jgi:hypothetical protein